jgi:TonB family protein
MPLRRGQEGWVVVSYVVQVDGTVVDPIVVESSGVADFEEAALETVLGWTYEPATQGGEPVQQCQTKTQITFAIETEDRGARKKFIRRYNKITGLLDDGDIDDAESLLDETMAMGEWNLYEYARLWLMTSLVAQQNGDTRAELNALYKTVGKKGDFIETQLLDAVLPRMLQLELLLSDYSDAMDTYVQILARPKVAEKYASLLGVVDQLAEIIASEQVLLSPASLQDCSDCLPRWTYEPLRRSFAFENIDGELEELELRCEWRRYRHQIDEELSWDIPESWGKCQLSVYGASGTTFDFLEYPENKKIQSAIATSMIDQD